MINSVRTFRARCAVLPREEREAMRPLGIAVQNYFVSRFKSLPIYQFLKGGKTVPLPPILAWGIVTYIKFVYL